MGDACTEISTMIPENHKKIGIDACLPLINRAFPDQDMGYFLLGNWFTDMSQGIAPVDYAATMSDARNEGVESAKKDSWFLRYVVPDFIIHSQANKFVRELLGNPPPTNSAMAKWFTNAAYVAGWIEFCWEDGPAKKLADQRAGPINFYEYDRIFHGKKSGKSNVRGRYTQYFPHEHFDRWPMDIVDKSQRKVYKYVEDDIRNIAELLTLVEHDLAKFISVQDDKAKEKLHDLLVEFGYALHTAEDYWAHTNFVDFAMKSINDIPKDSKQRRIHERRLLRDKKPRTKMFDEPGPTEPETHVVGGYFDGIDTRFSLLQLYKGLMAKLGSGPQAKAGWNYLDWRKAKTKEQRSGYKEGLVVKQDRMNMPKKVRDAELAFIELDWKMVDDWDGKCVSWILEKMLKEGEEYANKKFPAHKGEEPVSYAERVGSHTLIAKDDTTKPPGFEYAMNLAKFVDKYIVETMVRNNIFNSKVEVTTGDKIKIRLINYVDWLDLLQYFMGHPDEAPTNWWKSVMQKGNGDHKHKLKFISLEEANERTKLNTRARLEEEHNSMIKIENVKYEAEYRRDGHSVMETITLSKKGESKTYQQDDIDHGSIRVRCLKSKIQIDLYARVWYTFEKLSTLQVNEGSLWSGGFKELSSVYDQDNRAVITALSDNAQYEIMMASYDK